MKYAIIRRQAQYYGTHIAESLDIGLRHLIGSPFIGAAPAWSQERV